MCEQTRNTHEKGGTPILTLYLLPTFSLHVLSFLYVQGEDILEKSSELIHSGELVKISKGHAQDRRGISSSLTTSWCTARRCVRAYLSVCGYFLMCVCACVHACV